MDGVVEIITGRERRRQWSTPAAVPTGLIEIELGDGRRVGVGSDVNLPALRRVLTVLSR